MSTEAQKRASIKYSANNTTRLYISLNNKTDGDIIEFLKGLTNKQGFVKEALREKMGR